MTDHIAARCSRLFVALSVAAALGCGAPKTPDTADAATAMSNPVGSVGGAVIDAATEQPVVGATVKLISPGKALTATTDADGLFTVTGVPAGGFIATVSAMGYEAALINGALNGAVGEVPVQNPIATIGPVGLVKTTGTFTVQLVDEDGNPVPMVNLVARPQLRWVDFSNGAPRAVGDYEVTATSGADGAATFSGLPDYAQLGALGGGAIDLVIIDVPPLMVGTSMNAYAYLGATFSFQVDHLAGGATVDSAVIRVVGPSTPLQVLASNLPVLRGLSAPGQLNFSAVATQGFVAANGPVSIELNQAVDPSSLRATLLNEDGTLAATPLMATVTRNLVVLTPAAALTAGARYNVALHCDAAVTSPLPAVMREIDVMVPLFIAPASGATLHVVTPFRALAIPVASSFVVTFSEPVGPGFGIGSPVSCLAFYKLSGVGLDNSPTLLYPGEYDALHPGEVTCPNPGFDLTAMRPLEGLTAAGTLDSQLPITGFSTQWQLTYDIAGSPECKPGTSVAASTCAPPTVGTMVTLEPSRAIGTNTLKRADGTPVPDNAASLSFLIPPP